MAGVTPFDAQNCDTVFKERHKKGILFILQTLYAETAYSWYSFIPQSQLYNQCTQLLFLTRTAHASCVSYMTYVTNVHGCAWVSKLESLKTKFCFL